MSSIDKLPKNIFLYCIDKLTKLGIENTNKQNRSFLEDKTKISKNIKSIIHKNIITKFKNINKGKIGHIFGHGPSLNLINTFKKSDRDIFASTNKVYYHEKIKDKLDYYFGGDLYFCTDENYKRYKKMGKCLNGISYDKVKSISTNNKKYINDISGQTHVFLQVGQNNSYHKYHGFDDKGIIDCLKKGFIPIMRHDTNCSNNIIDNGFSHPTTFALLDFLIYTGCERIYLYGQDCGTKYFYSDFKNTNDTSHKNDMYKIWKKYLSTTKYKNLFFVNSNKFKNNIKSDSTIK